MVRVPLIFFCNNQWCKEAPLRELHALSIFTLDRDASIVDNRDRVSDAHI